LKCGDFGIVSSAAAQQDGGDQYQVFFILFFGFG
jgi:hypothetical protein